MSYETLKRHYRDAGTSINKGKSGLCLKNQKNVQGMQNNIVGSFKTYLETIGYSKTTQNNLPNQTLKFINYLERERNSYDIKKVVEKDIESYKIYLEQKPNQRSKSGSLSASTIYQNIHAIKVFYNYLVQMEMIKMNPGTNIKCNRNTIKPREIVTQEEIKTLFNNAETLTETSILHLAYSCGLRRTEIEDVEIRDIHFRENRVYVRAGKYKKRRVIPITEKVKQDLKKYYLEQRKPSKSNSFLVNERGNKMKGSTISNILKIIVNKAGLKQNISLHSLRHSIATHLLENGMRVEYIRDFLGHSVLATTQIYTRITTLKLIDDG